MKIWSQSGDEPHKSWGGWENFLTSCEVRDEHDGVTFYGKTNCNFIVFPDGMMVQNYGYHGRVLMGRIREEGRDVVRAEIERNDAELKDMLGKLTKDSKPKLKKRGRKRMLDTPEEIQRVCELYFLSDMSAMAIAQRYKVSPGVVTRVLDESATAWCKEHNQELAEHRFWKQNRHYDGATREEIESVVGTPSPRV